MVSLFCRKCTFISTCKFKNLRWDYKHHYKITHISVFIQCGQELGHSNFTYLETFSVSQNPKLTNLCEISR